VLRGSLEDLDSLRSGAANSDGVIHTAFIHDFLELRGRFGGGSARHRDARHGARRIWPPIRRHFRDLAPSMRKLPCNGAGCGRSQFPRKSEAVGLALASHGMRVSVVRLPPSVHGDGDRGFIPRLFAIAREKGHFRVCRSRAQSLACCAPARCCSSLQAGA
jgi:hypothetical protein